MVLISTCLGCVASVLLGIALRSLDSRVQSDCWGLVLCEGFRNIGIVFAWAVTINWPRLTSLTYFEGFRFVEA